MFPNTRFIHPFMFIMLFRLHRNIRLTRLHTPSSFTTTQKKCHPTADFRFLVLFGNNPLCPSSATAASFFTTGFATFFSSSFHFRITSFSNTSIFNKSNFSSSNRSTINLVHSPLESLPPHKSTHPFSDSTTQFYSLQYVLNKPHASAHNTAIDCS